MVSQLTQRKLFGLRSKVRALYAIFGISVLITLLAGIILATFGLMDAITNFMIFYLEGNSAVTTVTYFFISMLPILIVLAIIGAVMSKRLR